MTKIKSIPCPNPEEQPKMFLKLEDSFNGVTVRAVYEDGTPVLHGAIVEINENGVYRFENIFPKVLKYFGFKKLEGYSRLADEGTK